MGGMPSGKGLVPRIIDEIAAQEPDRLCLTFPRTTNLQDGFRTMTFGAFSKAINRTAHFIQREIGRSSMFETVMYLGYPDVRHFIVLVALIKTGHKVLFSSHQNSVAGHTSLVKRTDCTILLHTDGFPVSGILETSRMESLCMPELEYLLDDSPCPAYPYDKTFEEAKHHPVMVVHSLSPAGTPKPMVWTNWTLSTGDPRYIVHPADTPPTVWGGMFEDCRQAYISLPVYHGAALGMAVSAMSFYKMNILLGPPGHVNADLLSVMLNLGEVDAVCVVSATLEDASSRPDILSKLQRLRFAAVVDGSLSSRAHEKLSRLLRLYEVTAGTSSPHVAQPTGNL